MLRINMIFFRSYYFILSKFQINLRNRPTMSYLFVGIKTKKKNIIKSNYLPSTVGVGVADIGRLWDW